MLKTANAMATIAVKDLEKARMFYEGLLHLEPVGQGDSGVSTYRSGNSTIVIYESQFAGTNQATTVTWGLGDELEAVVKALRDAGIIFEHYDLPEARRDGDVYVFAGFKCAWFKDPDGNILHLNSA